MRREGIKGEVKSLGMVGVDEIFGIRTGGKRVSMMRILVGFYFRQSIEPYILGLHC